MSGQTNMGKDIVTIRANGQARVVRAGSTLADLLRELQITPTWVVVQLDGTIVPRSDYNQVLLREGSKLEIITLVGGG